MILLTHLQASARWQRIPNSLLLLPSACNTYRVTTYAALYMHTCIHTYITCNTYIHTCIHTLHIYIYIYIYTHTHTHTLHTSIYIYIYTLHTYKHTIHYIQYIQYICTLHTYTHTFIPASTTYFRQNFVNMFLLIYIYVKF